MNSEELRRIILKKINTDKTEGIRITYQEFVDNELLFSEIFGNEGFLMLADNRAFICFDSCKNIRIFIKLNNGFKLSDINFQYLELDIIGKTKKDLKMNLFEDFKNNWILMLLVSAIYISLFNFTYINSEGLSSLIEILINITSIFMATLFVFVGFSYGDKERAINTYKNGAGDKEYFTYRYIISISISIIILLVLSSSLLKYSIKETDTFYILVVIYVGKLINYKLLYLIAGILTWVSILLLIICFDSLMNYYMSQIRNKYLIDAVNDLNEIRYNKKHNKKQ